MPSDLEMTAFATDYKQPEKNNRWKETRNLEERKQCRKDM